MSRVLAAETPRLVGKDVLVQGWVQTRRDHGGLIFIDFRDHTGIAQLVINPDRPEAFKIAETLRDEFVISASGTVSQRAPELVNNKIPTGTIEIRVKELEVLNQSEAPPIQIHGEAMSGEEHRLKYRYLDLRRPKMQQMLKKRGQMYQIIRKFMEDREFTEVATPILANSSPEGARDFLIPSRLQEGEFYALPQAPQQFKQLLMVGGVSRYYQLAACFRDEDPRADRLYGEFYQLDLEMSFVEDGEVVRQETEPLIKQLVTDFAGKKLLTDKIPRIPYAEAMEKYGTDKPDLRYGLELVDLTDELKTTEFGVFKNAECVKAIRVPNAGDLSRSQIDKFTELAKSEGAGGLAYITYQDGEAKSPIAKFLKTEELKAIQKITGAKDGDVVFFGADKRATVNKVLGALRDAFAEQFELKNPDVIALAWIVDFPFYERDEKTGKVDFGHNPFSMPKGGIKTLEAAKTDEDRLKIVADQYDMVMNGYEICSGAVRNHRPNVMYRVFAALGYDEKYVEEKFGAMLGAFKYGAPPHAGCAYGIDRMFMELMGEANIREIVAFPKNGSGQDTMMNSPSTVDPTQLKELNIETLE